MFDYRTAKAIRDHRMEVSRVRAAPTEALSASLRMLTSFRAHMAAIVRRLLVIREHRVVDPEAQDAG